jgi:peptidoglycan/LPS O-acetylase OafA/YrhL
LTSGVATSPATPKLPALTGLRMLAAFAVYVSHIGPPQGASGAVKSIFEAGYMGVTLFFVLSGFVLAINYFDRLVRPTVGAVWQFTIARFARIYPLYILVLLFIVTRWQITEVPTTKWWENALAIQAWDSNLGQTFNFDGPAWSVSVELFLYACFPLLVPVLGRLRSARALLSAGAVLALAMTALAAWFTFTGRNELPLADPGSAHRWLYVMPLPRLGDFMLGILAARLFLLTRERPGAVRTGGPLAVSAAIAIVALMAWPTFLLSTWSWDVGYALPSTVLIFGLAVAPRAAFARWLSATVVVLLGEASYAFYLVHAPMLTFLDTERWTVALSTTTVVYEILTLGVIACLALGLHLLVERPARRRIRMTLGAGRPSIRPSSETKMWLQPAVLGAGSRESDEHSEAHVRNG